MGCLKRLYERAVETRHIHDFVIGADIALNQPVSDLLCVPKVIAELLPVSSPRNGRAENTEGRPSKRAPQGRPGRNVEFGRAKGMNTAQLTRMTEILQPLSLMCVP